LDPDLSVFAGHVSRDVIAAWPGWGGIRNTWLRDPRLDAKWRPVPDRFIGLPFGRLRPIPPGSQIEIFVDPLAPAIELREYEASSGQVSAREALIERVRDIARPALVQDDSVRSLQEPGYGLISELVWELLSDDRDAALLADAPVCVSDILLSAGLESHREWFGRPGSSWWRIDHHAAAWRLVDAEDVEAIPWDEWDGRFPRRNHGSVFDEEWT
jgi:hypothetical protein